MSGQLLLALSQPRVSAAPGAPAELALTVRNLTSLVDEYSLRSEGVEPGWVQFVPEHLPVFAQGQGAARAILTPPSNLAAAAAGPYPLRIYAASQEHRGEEAVAEATLDVQLVGDYRLQLDQQTGGQADGAFLLKVHNMSNARLRLRLSGSDGNDALWYKFEPFQLLLAPMSEGSVTLLLRRRKADLQGTLLFRVKAEGEYMLRDESVATAPAVEVTGEFRPSPLPAITLRLSAIGRQDGGEYEAVVRNPAPVARRVRLTSDEAGELLVDVDPSTLELPPQGEARARVRVRPASALGPAVRVDRTFRLRAEDGGGNAEATGRFVHEPALVEPPEPTRMPWWIIVLIALLLVALAAVIIATLR